MLAWVIYATPATNAIPICGGWELYAYNALTSQGIILSAYGRGP